MFRRLASAPSPLEGAAWTIARAALRTLGRASRGIRIGCRHGFESGVSLDHVYRNHAEGVTPIGRLIDRIYLNSAGWRAIRERRATLETLLRRTIGELAADGRPIRIFDIAAGGGRYVLDTLRDLPHVPITAVLRDADPVNIVAAQRRAATLGLAHVQCGVGDAFDRSSIASVRPRPTIAIASGLWELFPDNRKIEASLAGLRDALEDGGYLIYTNQPWHPQLRLIARLLTNRERRPWVMRCRSQSEIDALVHRFGFEKVEMALDDSGICSVSVARKV
jgi:putative methyltransferase